MINIEKLKKDLNKLSLYKKPLKEDTSNYIGIEIECFIPEGHSPIDIGLAFSDFDLLDNVNFGYDPSISPWKFHEGIEFRLLLKEEELEEKLFNFCQVLTAFDVQVNNSCGLHVHLDMRRKDVFNSARKLIYFTPLLKKLISSSRKKENQYVYFDNNLFNGKDKDALEIAEYCLDHSNHYDAINIGDAYRNKKTIEVRMFHGCLDFTQIFCWIKLLLSIVSLDKLPSRKPRQINKLVKLLNLENDILDFIGFRTIKKFNKESWKNKRRNSMKKAEELLNFSASNDLPYGGFDYISRCFNDDTIKNFLDKGAKNERENSLS